MLIGLVILAIFCADSQAHIEGQEMSVTFYGSNVDEPITLDVEPVPIETVSEPAPMPNAEPAPDKSGCIRPFANQQLNSRLAATAPDSSLEIMWQADLNEDLLSMFVLRAANRVVVQQEGAWQLFDHKGEAVARGPHEAGYIVMDAANDLFYTCDPFGFMSARDISNGGEKFALFTAFGEGFSRTALSRENQRMFVLSTELPKVVEEGFREPEYTIMEIHDLGKPIEVDAERVLTSAWRQTILMVRGMPFLTALHDHTLVMAATDHIFLADENLKITSDFQGEFIPMAMSLDEAMRIYLIVRTKEGEHALWILTPEGKRIADAKIPTLADGAYSPPIIGYDHRVYVLLERRAIAISSSGEELWSQQVPGTIAGACVTADDQLIISAGSVLAAINAQGEYRVLHYFADETLVTPPILTKRGRLMVASERHLYCLKPRK